MKAQTPAEGISVNNKYSDGSCSYHVECSCTCEAHALDVWVDISSEEDWPEVEVTFYMKMWYPPFKGFWHRIKSAMSVLFTGHAEREHTILLNPQAAKNFSAAIEKSIADIEANQPTKGQ